MISGRSGQFAVAASTIARDIRHGRQQDAQPVAAAAQDRRRVSPNGSISRLTSPLREPGSSSSVLSRRPARAVAAAALRPPRASLARASAGGRQRCRAGRRGARARPARTAAGKARDRHAGASPAPGRAARPRRSGRHSGRSGWPGAAALTLRATRRVKSGLSMVTRQSGLAADDRARGLADPPHQPRQVADDRAEPHQRDLGGVEQASSAPRPADGGRRRRRARSAFRLIGRKRAHEIGAEQIAGFLAGDDGDAQRRAARRSRAVLRQADHEKAERVGIGAAPPS